MIPRVIQSLVLAGLFTSSACLATPEHALDREIASLTTRLHASGDDAVLTIQQMVDDRPDLASYSRAAYLRELHGDVPGAIDAMNRALAAGGATPEKTAWCAVQLGHLRFGAGDLAGADAEYRRAL